MQRCALILSLLLCASLALATVPVTHHHHTHTQPQVQTQQQNVAQQQMQSQAVPSASDLAQRRLELLEKMMELQTPSWSPFTPFVHSPLAATGMLSPFHNTWSNSLLSPFNQFGMGLSPFQPFNYLNDPFSSLYNTHSALQRSMNELNNQLNKVEEQSISSNWNEHETAYVLDVKLPKGAKKDDLKVNVRNNILTVSGSVNVQDEATGSVNSSSFTRVMSVPTDVDQQAIRANLDSGVLKITLQKTPKAIEEGKKGEIKIEHTQQQPVAAA